MRLRLGTAFDLVGERRQVDFAVDTRARWMEEEIEIKLRNHKAQAVEIEVREPIYRWSNWRILSNSHEYKKDTVQRVHFTISVPRDGESMLRYRVRYTW